MRQGSFTSYGPFIVERQTFLSTLSTRPASVTWYALPVQLLGSTVGIFPGLRQRVAGIPNALGTRNDGSATMHVSTSLAN